MTGLGLGNTLTELKGRISSREWGNRGVWTHPDG